MAHKTVTFKITFETPELTEKTADEIIQVVYDELQALLGNMLFVTHKTTLEDGTSHIIHPVLGFKVIKQED